jgi:hypothetical protein
MFVENIKKYLRRSKIAIAIYYNLKRLIIFPLKFTTLKPIVTTWLPLKDLFDPYKISLFSKAAKYSMGNYPRMTNVYDLACNIEKRKLPGAYVECGSWKGGLAGIMATIANKNGTRRTTWYFDSFEGMPEAGEHDIAYTKEGKKRPDEHMLVGIAKSSVEDVKELIKKLKLPPENNKIVKGWFEKTLPERKEEIGDIAILRMDADWYSSTMIIFEELYDQVVDGGWIIIDDYGGWEGCRKATHEFFEKRNIIPNLRFIGVYDPKRFKNKMPGVYFKKGEACKDKSFFEYLKIQ